MKTKIALGLLILLCLGAAYWVLAQMELPAIVTDRDALRGWVEQLGPWGPAAIFLLMILSIVIGPIPTVPIAMVAGALYGRVWGTFYVLLGAEAGALAAFFIARYLGYEVLRRWPRVRPLLHWLERERSQNWLTVIVFGTRLLPVISFAAVSYAAGLTPLAWWRFALATLAGLVPMTYLFVAAGAGLTGDEPLHAVLLLIVIGAVTLIPGRLLWNRSRLRASR